jgi:cephalosporin hydroxylase
VANGIPDDTIRRFHELYFGSRVWARGRTTWLGVPVLKCPLDMWVYQEILWSRQPDVVIETGTCQGGSALFMAQVFDRIGSGRVVTVDLESPQAPPAHPRITYLSGSSTAPQTVSAVQDAIAGAGKTMVILDSDHARDHVLDELRIYAPLVTPGQYLIVEDTNLNGHPVAAEHGPGPKEALEHYLDTEGGADDFEVDAECERLLMTFNPGGFLVRRASFTKP